MNSRSNARHFPRECTLLPSSSRAFPTNLSSRTSYRAAIFFLPLRLSSARFWLLAFQPMWNVSLNVPQNRCRIFLLFSFLFLVQLFPFVFTFIKIPCSPTWYIEVRSEIELLVAHGMTWNIFSGMHTRNPCVFHLYRVSFRFPRSQQIEHFILLKTLSTLFFALIFCLLYSCFIPSFFYWISKRCSTTTHFLFLRHGPATSIVGKRRVRLFARILERAIRECERSGAADNPERSESRGQEEGYLTTKSFCLMSVDDAVWNILKECRKSIREVDTTGKRVNREVKGEIRVDTLGRRDGGRSKCNQTTHFSRREAQTLRMVASWRWKFTLVCFHFYAFKPVAFPVGYWWIHGSCYARSSSFGFEKIRFQRISGARETRQEVLWTWLAVTPKRLTEALMSLEQKGNGERGKNVWAN